MVFVIFDGTTQVTEAMVIIVRYINDISEKWGIEQSIARLLLLSKSITGEEVAHQPISNLLIHLGIQSHLLLRAMSDCASVNNVAMRTLKIVYNNIMDVGCFSHLLHHVREKMQTDVLMKFTTAWSILFVHSSAARLASKTRTGQT